MQRLARVAAAAILGWPLLLVRLPASAAELAAALASVSGPVRVRDGGRDRAAIAGAPIAAGTEIAIGAGGSAVLAFSNGTKVRAESGTTMRVTEASASSTFLELTRGVLQCWVRGLEGGRFRVRSGAAVAAVRGTVFTARNDGRTLRFDVFEGLLDVRDSWGRATMAERGQRVTVTDSGLSGTSSLPSDAKAPSEPQVALPAAKPASTAAKETGPAAPKEIPASTNAPQTTNSVQEQSSGVVSPSSP